MHVGNRSLKRRAFIVDWLHRHDTVEHVHTWANIIRANVIKLVIHLRYARHGPHRRKWGEAGMRLKHKFHTVDFSAWVVELLSCNSHIGPTLRKKKKKNSSQLLHWRTKGLVVVDWLYQWWCCALEPYCEKSCLARYIKCNARPHSMSFIKCCICAVKVSSSHLVSHCTVCSSGWLLFLQQFESLPSKLSDASHCHISVRLTLHITRTSMLYSDKNKEKKNTPHITCIIDCII